MLVFPVLQNFFLTLHYLIGELLGQAFQIKDDLFDLLGSESDTGKNSGGDVKQNMVTLPLIFSKANMSRLEYRELKKLLRTKKKNRSIIKKISDMVEETGGIDYAKKKLDEFSELAVNAINVYPESEVKTSLIDLVALMHLE